MPYKKNIKCIVVSKFGKGFIADLLNIQTSQKKGKQLFNLKLGDELIKLSKNIKTHIACVSKNSKLLNSSLDYKGKIIIVIGSEGSCMRKLIKKSCDFLTTIPMKGKINSLNVSAALSAILFERQRQLESSK